MPLLHFNFIEIVYFTTCHTNFLLAYIQNSLTKRRDFLTERNFYLSNISYIYPYLSEASIYLQTKIEHTFCLQKEA